MLFAAFSWAIDHIRQYLFTMSKHAQSETLLHIIDNELLMHTRV